MVKTTFTFPEALWLKAKHRALDERASLLEIVTRALELYLKTPPSKR